jgi:hypothetical protein
MKNKAVILTAAIVLSIILFTISTYAQKKLVNYEPKIECLFLKEDIKANEKVEKEMFVVKEIPVSLVVNTKILMNYNEIENLYSKDNIYKGQIALAKQFDTKENLSIYESEEGKERVSIKIKSAENGVSYSIKNNSLVNVYVTLRMDLAKDFLKDKERLTIFSEDDGYTIIKLLENVNIIETFDVDGNKTEETNSNIIDTIIVGVTSEEAKQINLLREIGTFNISGV